MLFRFETLVKISVFTCAVAFAATAGAADTAKPADVSTASGDATSSATLQQSSSCGDVEKAARSGFICEGAKTPEGKQACLDRVSRAEAMCTSQSGCAGAIQKYKDAQSKFKDACQKANLDESGESGNFSCSKKIQECNSLESLNAKKSSSATSKLPYNLSLARIQKRKCPAALSKDLDKLKEDLKDQEKSVKELEEKNITATEDANKAKSESRKAETEAGDGANTAEAEHLDKVTQIQKAQDDAIKEQTNQLVALQGQIDQAYTQLRGVEQAKAEAQATYEETMVQIDMNCRAKASAEVAKLQSEMAPNLGSQRSMWSYVGLTSRQAWQRQAAKFYKYCAADSATIESRTSAQRARALKYKAAESARATALAGIQSLQAQMLKVRSDQGCGMGGPAGQQFSETDTCKGLRQTASDLEKEDYLFNKKQDTLDAKKRSAFEDSTQAALLQKRRLFNNTQEVTDEKKRLENMRQYTELAYQAAPSGPPDPDSTKNAWRTYGNLNSAASILASESECKGAQIDEVKKAKDYLNTIYPGSAGDDKNIIEAPAPLAPASTTPPKTDGAGAAPENSHFGGPH